MVVHALVSTSHLRLCLSPESGQVMVPICTYNDFGMQEVTLPDGSSFKIFDMCAVKIKVDTKENHRESLRIELIDRSLVPKTDLVA